MKTSEVLRKAGDVLREQGWIQGRMGRDGGPRCAVGALVEASGFNYTDAIQPLKDIVCDGTPNVDAWNDTPGRTAAEVQIAMDAAHVLALQEEGVEPEDVL